MNQRLTLPYPPPLHDCFTNAKERGRVPTKRYKDWTTAALWEIASQRPQRFTGEVSVSVGVVAPDRRARDADNLLKPLMDVLKKAGVIVDDSNRYVRRISIEWVAAGSPVTVLIQNYESAAG